MTERLLVRDLMTVGVATCSPATPVIEVARLLLEQNLEGIVVLDIEGQATGVVTQDELVQAYTRKDGRELTAEDIMRADIPRFLPDIPLATAAQLMQDQGVRVAFYLHQASGVFYPAAVLTYRHFLRHLAAQNDDDLKDLGIKAARQSPLETFIQRRDEARRKHQFPQQE